jgi:cytochrome c-type biogenesis protein CcmH/NrfF
MHWRKDVATKEMIDDMLRLFGASWNKEITDDLKQAFLEVLQKYSNDEVIEAGYKCLEEREFFPKPAHVVKFIKTTKRKHNEALKDRFRCPVCKNQVSLIIEGRCWECNTGASLSMGRTPVKAPVITQEKNFLLIEEGIRCQKCGNVGAAIKEPADTGEWECRQCYSGLTIEQYKEKMAGIIASIGNANKT